MSDPKKTKWTTRGTTVAATAGYDDKEADAARRQVGDGRPGDESYVAVPTGQALPPDLGPGWSKVATVKPAGVSKPYDVYARPNGTGKPSDKPKPPPPGAKPGPEDRPDGDPKGSPDGTKPKSQAPPGEAALKDVDKNFARKDVGCTVGECGKEFAKGFAEGGILAFIVGFIVAAFFPELIPLLLLLGTSALVADAIDLAQNWDKLSGPEIARRLGNMTGGVVGGAAGGKAGGGFRGGGPIEAGPPRPGGDPWVSEQGTRPAPGTRDVTEGQFREGDANYRAKDTAEGYDGHGHGRHGAQTTMGEQTRRVQTGETPDGNRAPTSKATKFDSHAKEVEAVERAKAKQPWNGQPEYRPNGQPNRVSTVVPDGPDGYGEGVQVQRGPNGQPLPGRPVEPTGRQPNANVVFEYNPRTGQWDPVTQYPTDEPVTP